MRRCITLLLLGLLAGCSTLDTLSRYLSGGKDNSEPPSPLVTFQTKLNVAELWSASVGNGTEEQYLKLSPVIANQRMFVADTDGTLSALDATNGSDIWSKDTDVPISGGPGFGEDTVLIGTSNGEVLAYTAENGKLLWRAQLSSEVLSAPARSQGIVVARTNDGKVFGLDGNSGKRLWSYDRVVPPLTLRGTSAPVIAGNAVIAGFDGGRLTALELSTGRLLWETSIAAASGRSELERMVDIDSAPVAVDGVIYVATFQGYVSALQQDSGRIIWSREVSSYAGFSVDGAQLYITDDNSHVMALDRYTGSTNWIQEKLHARGVTGPEAVGDYIVAGDVEGYLHWMSKADGEFVARNRLCDKRILVPPVAAGRVLYAFCSNGDVGAYAFR